MTDQEKNARKALLEELFRDFHTNRLQIYKINFIRGVFFGFGSVIGGTVVVALVVWLLNTTGALIPAFDGLTNSIADKVQQQK